MVTADSKYIKNINRSKIIEQIVNNKEISRADISKKTYINKVTVSSQVSELLNDELLIEKKTETANVGRNPILLSINKSAGYSIGVEIDFNKMVFIVTNLVGELINNIQVNIDNTFFDNIISKLYSNIDNLIKKLPSCKFGVIGISIGIHGVVNNNGDIIFSPSLNWKDIKLKQLLEEKYNVDVFIQNNNQFSVFAEKIFNYNSNKNILYLNITSGLGLGIIIDNKIYKGLNGFAGEIGHMIVDLNGRPCPCGNRGCLERYCSEKVVLDMLKKEYKNSEINSILENIKEPENNLVLKEFIDYLSLGLNNVINTFNSEIIIINSNIIRKFPYMLDELKNNLKSTMNNYKKIVLSDFGENSCAYGAAVNNIKSFLKIENISL